MVLILLGNAGVVTAISSLIIGFTGSESSASDMRNLYLLIFGASLLFFAARSNRLDNFLERIINRVLRQYTDIRPTSFSKLITVMEDYEVVELKVSENGWLAGQALSDLKLTDEGILVLGIYRDDSTYIGVPRGRYEIVEDDRLIIYGKADRIAALSDRADPLEGKVSHKEAVDTHQAELEEQDSEVD